MPSYIVHHEGAYNIYSTIFDGFYFEPACTLDQLTEWYEAEHGRWGMKDLPPRLERAHARGTSSLNRNADLESTIKGNRAGPDEKRLPFDECIKRFLTVPQL